MSRERKLTLDGIGVLFANETIRFMYMFLSGSIFLVAFAFLVVAFKIGLTHKKGYREI